MTRLKTVSPENATGKTKELYSAIQSKLGMVPNMMQTMGSSPALLEGYLQLSGALGGGVLGAATGELIALAVAESNACNYCLSAHTFIGANLLKIDTAAMDAARQGEAANAKTAALLQFAKALVDKKGQVSNADVQQVKDAGAAEAEIAETIGHVALNVLTNYFNNTANTSIDFPVVEAGAAVTV
jgi:uncharacterized peroxidase-related enzyme